MEELATLCCKLALLPVEYAFDDWMDGEDELASLRVVVVDENHHHLDALRTQGMGGEDDENQRMKCDGDDDKDHQQQRQQQQQQHQQQQQQQQEQRWHDRSLACNTGTKSLHNCRTNTCRTNTCRTHITTGIQYHYYR